MPPLLKLRESSKRRRQLLPPPRLNKSKRRLKRLKPLLPKNSLKPSPPKRPLMQQKLLMKMSRGLRNYRKLQIEKRLNSRPHPLKLNRKRRRLRRLLSLQRKNRRRLKPPPKRLKRPKN